MPRLPPRPSRLRHLSGRIGGRSIAGLAAGDVHVGFDAVTAAGELARAGRIRPVAITSSARSAAFPDLPTAAETVPGFVAATWAGAFVPSATPTAIVQRLNAAIARAIGDQGTREKIISSGAVPGGESAEEFATFISGEIAMWARVIDDAKIQIE